MWPISCPPPGDPDHELRAERLLLGAVLTGRIEDDLSQTVTIAKIEETKATVIPHALHPPVQDDLRADVVAAKITTGVSPLREPGCRPG